MRVPITIGLVAGAAMLWWAAPVTAEETPPLPGIVGEDDRVPINTREWPWTAIGRVNRSTGGFCTGVLIGPQHVLTVAHCLYDEDLSKWVELADLHFVAGYSRGDFVAHMQAEHVIVPAEYEPERPEDPQNLIHDWAIIVVRGNAGVRPVPWRMLEPSDVAAGLTNGTLTRAGYSQDRAHMLAAHQGCSIVGWDSDLMLHDCDGTSGDSGSPVLMQIGGNTTLVGVNVGYRQSADTTLGIAIPAAVFHDAAKSASSSR